MIGLSFTTLTPAGTCSEKYRSAADDCYADRDYEHDRTVSAAEAPKVLMLLIKERFKHLFELEQWLYANEIRVGGFSF